MPFKKGFKPKKKVEVKEEAKEVKTEVIEEETPVTSVEEKGITVEDIEKTIKVLEGKKDDEIGNVAGTAVHATPRGIRFETYKSPVPIFKIKDPEIYQWLRNKGYGTDVYKKDKEWLEKHNVDMKMVEKLKKYLSDSYNI